MSETPHPVLEEFYPENSKMTSEQERISKNRLGTSSEADELIKRIIALRDMPNDSVNTQTELENIRTKLKSYMERMQETAEAENLNQIDAIQVKNRQDRFNDLLNPTNLAERGILASERVELTGVLSIIKDHTASHPIFKFLEISTSGNLNNCMLRKMGNPSALGAVYEILNLVNQPTGLCLKVPSADGGNSNYGGANRSERAYYLYGSALVSKEASGAIVDAVVLQPLKGEASENSNYQASLTDGSKLVFQTGIVMELMPSEFTEVLRTTEALQAQELRFAAGVISASYYQIRKFFGPLLIPVALTWELSDHGMPMLDRKPADIRFTRDSNRIGLIDISLTGMEKQNQPNKVTAHLQILRALHEAITGYAYSHGNQTTDIIPALVYLVSFWSGRQFSNDLEPEKNAKALAKMFLFSLISKDIIEARRSDSNNKLSLVQANLPEVIARKLRTSQELNGGSTRTLDMNVGLVESLFNDMEIKNLVENTQSSSEIAELKKIYGSLSWPDFKIRLNLIDLNELLGLAIASLVENQTKAVPLSLENSVNPASEVPINLPFAAQTGPIMEIMNRVNNSRSTTTWPNNDPIMSQVFTPRGVDYSRVKGLSSYSCFRTLLSLVADQAENMKKGYDFTLFRVKISTDPSINDIIENKIGVWTSLSLEYQILVEAIITRLKEVIETQRSDQAISVSNEVSYKTEDSNRKAVDFFLKELKIISSDWYINLVLDLIINVGKPLAIPDALEVVQLKPTQSHSVPEESASQSTTSEVPNSFILDPSGPISKLVSRIGGIDNPESKARLYSVFKSTGEIELPMLADLTVKELVMILYTLVRKPLSSAEQNAKMSLFKSSIVVNSVLYSNAIKSGNFTSLGAWSNLDPTYQPLVKEVAKQFLLKIPQEKQRPLGKNEPNSENELEKTEKQARSLLKIIKSYISNFSAEDYLLLDLIINSQT